MKVKIVSALVLLAALIMILTVSVGATEIIDAGKCGDNLNWTLSVYGVLEITGTGEMWNYKFDNTPPWYRYRGELTSLVLNEGITYIGEWAFYDCRWIKSGLTIPDGVTAIGQRAFVDCFEMAGELTIPDSVTSIGECAFAECRKLTSVTIGSNVTNIGWSAFYNCWAMTGATFMGDVPDDFGESVFKSRQEGFAIYYRNGKTGWTTPEWNGYPCYPVGGADPTPTPGGSERGDVNGDNKLDSNDAIYLLRHTMNSERYPITQSGDMNGDGKIDSNDAIHLLRHTMNPMRYPLVK